MSIAPIRREMLVATDPGTAFALFTAHLGSWWPLGAGHSVLGAGATVAFEGDLVVERKGAQRSVWAEVTAWSPPDGFALAWHPGADAPPSSTAVATTVTVSFQAAVAGTLVTLVHSGWERLAAAADARASYRHGWPTVLDCYRRRAGGDADPPAAAIRWFALTHRPGPAVPDGASVFGQPGFAGHVAFLHRLADAGLLVAAGPLPDEPGAGMTVVRVPDPAVDVVALATTDDQSVADGTLTVTVRPWDVRFTGEQYRR